jgi:hypothetical protein
MSSRIWIQGLHEGRVGEIGDTGIVRKEAKIGRAKIPMD